jgi:hypothetical protein
LSSSVSGQLIFSAENYKPVAVFRVLKFPAISFTSWSQIPLIMLADETIFALFGSILLGILIIAIAIAVASGRGIFAVMTSWVPYVVGGVTGIVGAVTVNGLGNYW